MVAIAGLANEFCNATGDTYLAGHWKADLYKQLCWAPKKAADSTRRAPCFAPTWSWASVNCPVRMDALYYMSIGKTMGLSEVLDVFVASDDPSGLHTFTSSKLRMRGISTRAKITTARSSETNVWEDVALSTLDSSRFYVSWDETHDSSNPRSHRHRQMEEDQAPELLFLFVSFDFREGWRLSEGNSLINGLVLKEESSSGECSTFFQTGCILG